MYPKNEMEKRTDALGVSMKEREMDKSCHISIGRQIFRVIRRYRNGKSYYHILSLQSLPELYNQKLNVQNVNFVCLCVCAYVIIYLYI